MASASVGDALSALFVLGQKPSNKQDQNHWLKLLPVAATVVVLALVLGYGALKPQPLILNNVVLAQPQPLPDFDLLSTGTGSKRFNRDALLGRWSLLFSGYTECPDVCPTTLSLLTQLQRNLPGHLPRLHTIFVTVDPQLDTLPKLGSYLNYFDPNAIGVTGSKPELNRLLSGLGFYGVTEKSPDPLAENQGRLLSHSGAVALINPQAKLHALLRAPLSLEKLEDQLQATLASSALLAN